MFKDLQLQILEDVTAHEGYVDYACESGFSVYQLDNSFGKIVKKRPEGLLQRVEEFTKTRETALTGDLLSATDLANTKANLLSLGLCLRAVGWRWQTDGAWASPLASAVAIEQIKTRARARASAHMREVRAKAKAAARRRASLAQSAS